MPRRTAEHLEALGQSDPFDLPYAARLLYLATMPALVFLGLSAMFAFENQSLLLAVTLGGLAIIIPAALIIAGDGFHRHLNPQSHERFWGR